MSKQKRQFFRIEYPIDERPCLIVGGDQYEVLDTSERGMRLSPLKSGPVPSTVKGTLRFRDGSECLVAGTVARQAPDGSLVVKLNVGIPLSQIMKEQRRLIQRYRAGA
jgi:hypothetical protein